MTKLNAMRTGLAVGAFLALSHLAWAAVVAARLAQPLLDFIFRLHFITPAFTVGAFDAGTAALLVLVTGGIGFAVGLVLALIWNGLARGRV